MIICRSFLTVSSMANWTSNWQASGAMSHSRHTFRSTATRHLSRPAHTSWLPAPSPSIWGWRGGSIAARYFRCSNASRLTFEHLSCNRQRTTSWNGWTSRRLLSWWPTLAAKTNDSVRRQKLFVLLSRRLAGAWNSAHNRPKVLQLIERTVSNPATRPQGMALAAATGDARYRGTFEAFAEDPEAPEEVRVAAIAAIGSFHVTPNRVLEQLVSSVRGKPSSNVVAEAAVRAMAEHAGAQSRLTELLTGKDYPLGVRRQALRSLAQIRDGGTQVIELARAGKLPEELKADAATMLHMSPDRRLREASR